MNISVCSSDVVGEVFASGLDGSAGFVAAVLSVMVGDESDRAGVQDFEQCRDDVGGCRFVLVRHVLVSKKAAQMPLAFVQVKV